MFIDNNDKQLLIQMAVNDSDVSLGGFSSSGVREREGKKLTFCDFLVHIA